MRVEPVFSTYAHKVLTRGNLVVANLLVFVPILAAFSGLGTAALVESIVDKHPEWKEPTLAAPAIAAHVITGLGVVLFLAASFIGLKYAQGLGNWYLRRQAVKYIGRHPNPFVQPTQPGAVFVEIVPRENIGRSMLETASDVGYAFVDSGRRELLIEADKDQYRIPAESIVKLDPIAETHSSVGHGFYLTYYFIGMHLSTSGGVREFYFRPREGSGLFGKKKRAAKVQALHRSISELL